MPVHMHARTHNPAAPYTRLICSPPVAASGMTGISPVPLIRQISPVCPRSRWMATRKGGAPHARGKARQNDDRASVPSARICPPLHAFSREPSLRLVPPVKSWGPSLHPSTSHCCASRELHLVLAMPCPYPRCLPTTTHTPTPALSQPCHSCHASPRLCLHPGCVSLTPHHLFTVPSSRPPPLRHALVHLGRALHPRPATFINQRSGYSLRPLYTSCAVTHAPMRFACQLFPYWHLP